MLILGSSSKIFRYPSWHRVDQLVAFFRCHRLPGLQYGGFQFLEIPWKKNFLSFRLTISYNFPIKLKYPFSWTTWWLIWLNVKRDLAGTSIFELVPNIRNQKVVQYVLINCSVNCRFRENNWPIPVAETHPQIRTDCGNFTLRLRQVLWKRSLGCLHTLQSLFPKGDATRH